MKKDSEIPRPAYNKEADHLSIIYNIVNELKQDGNKLAENYNLPWKELKWCNVSTVGSHIIMKVEERRGGFRMPQENPSVLLKELEYTKKLCDKFEKSIKSEFKKRAGKALKLSEGKTVCDFELVSYNGLYRFFCIKSGKITTTTEGQTWSDD